MNYWKYDGLNGGIKSINSSSQLFHGSNQGEQNSGPTEADPFFEPN